MEKNERVEKARSLYESLKNGKGLATLFGISYYDDEIREIIEVLTNECKATYVDKNGIKKRHESDIDIKTVREIVEQLLCDKGEIKNTLVAKLTNQRGVPGITKAMKIEKRVSENGLPYLEMDKPFPDNCTSILLGENNKEELIQNVIKPYVARLSKQTPQLSKKHFFSRIFNPLSRKEITDNELLNRYSQYLRSNTDLSDDKIENMSKYFIYNILGNNKIMQTLIDDEVQGTSLEVIGEKKSRGYNGMLSNISNNLFDILGTFENPNNGLEEIKDIYANITGQLKALGTEFEKEPEKIEEQIISINRNINRKRQEYYYENGYRSINVGVKERDVGFVNFRDVPQAMKLYAEQCSELIENADNMNKEEYIRQVAKMHFRFIHIHPFPDGNGRTARAISNIFLAKKNMCAVFDKETKGDYAKRVAWLDKDDITKYKNALCNDEKVCDEIENKTIYKLEEYIGIETLGEEELYKDRNITGELPKSKTIQNEQQR